MKAAAVGLRVHSGWTSLVVVALEKGKPAVLTRQRPHLVETFSYAFRQPYHTAERMSLHEAEDFLGRGAAGIPGDQGGAADGFGAPAS